MTINHNIHFYTKASRIFDDLVMQTYVQPTQIMYRIFGKVGNKYYSASEWDDKKVDEQNLWTNEDLLGGILSYEGTEYKCIYNKIVVLNENLLQPYREIYVCFRVPKADYTTTQDQMFFADRLGETYFSKGRNTHWSKHIKATGCQYLYRFIIKPNGDLTNSPCLCMQDLPLITNIKFDLSREYYADHLEIMGPWVDHHKPVVMINGPDTIKPNGIETFEVTVKNQSGSLIMDPLNFLVECKQGYAPNTEVKILNGKGAFKVMALGLEDGDSMRFKINDKVWTDYAEKQISVRS